MSNEIFDFGFTTVDENELDVIQQAQEKVSNASQETSALYKKLDKLYNSFAPLLNNLKKNTNIISLLSFKGAPIRPFRGLLLALLAGHGQSQLE